MSEHRQRWRLVMRRGEAARDLVHREVVQQWEAAIAAAGLPGTRPSDPVRPRLAFAAQVPARMLAERELVDLFLPDRLTLFELRSRLEPVLPPGFELVDLYDVWVGEPATPGRVVATDYRVSLLGPSRSAIAAAVAGILAADRVERGARKATKVGGDLRPFILGLRVVAWTGSGPGPGGGQVWLRLRHHQELGSGRPEEVVEALESRLGVPLEVSEIVRERVWLFGDLPDQTAAGTLS